MQYGKKLLDLTTKLLLHVTHCHTWCHHMGEWSRGHLIPPIVLPTIKRKLSTKEACVHKKVSKWKSPPRSRWDGKLFPPPPPNSKRESIESASTTSTSQWTFFCNCRDHQSLKILSAMGLFERLLFLRKKAIQQKNFLSNFLTCTTKYNYNGLDLAKTRVWVQCTLLPKRSNVAAVVGWKSIHLLHRIATLHAWLERIIYGKRKIWD